MTLEGLKILLGSGHRANKSKKAHGHKKGMRRAVLHACTFTPMVEQALLNSSVQGVSLADQESSFHACAGPRISPDNLQLINECAGAEIYRNHEQEGIDHSALQASHHAVYHISDRRQEQAKHSRPTELGKSKPAQRP